MKNNRKNLLIWAVILIPMLLLAVFNQEGKGKKITFSEFITKVETKEVGSVEIKGSELIGKLKDGSEFFTNLPNYPDLIDKLQENQIIIEVQPLVSKSEKIIGGLLGFLLHNFSSTKKVFLGDTGSLFIGATMAFFVIFILAY